MAQTYRTTEVAQRIGIHPNTVRMYEEWGLIAKPKRMANGYRVFNEMHIDQFQLARTALHIEVLQNGLRKKAITIVKAAAACEFEKALQHTQVYKLAIQEELAHAHEAISLVQALLSGGELEVKQSMKRKEVSQYLGITMDTLRNWEMNGLLQVSRKENGYRIYDAEAIRRLKIIRSLKCANYSLSAILRMLHVLEHNEQADIQAVLNTPREDEAILSVCDQLIVSLEEALKQVASMEALLIKMKSKYTNPPL